MKAKRNMNRSPAISEQHRKLLKSHKKNIAMMHNQEDLIDAIREAVPQVDPLCALRDPEDWNNDKKIPHMKVVNDATWQDIDIFTQNIPYEQVIEHIAGPIHRLLDTDWTATVYETGNIQLFGSTDTPNTKHHKTTIKIQVGNGIPTCRIVTTDLPPTITENKETKIICS